MQIANLVSRSGPPVGMYRKDPELQRDLALHAHDNVELVVVTSGGGLHCTEGGRWPIARGDVFAIPVGMAHGYARTRQLQLINLGYDPTRLTGPWAHLAGMPGFSALSLIEPRLRRHQAFAGHLHLNEPDLQGILAMAGELERELVQRAAGWESAAEGWMLQLLIRLARHYGALATPAAASALRLSAVVAWIEAHLAQPLDQEHLARIGHLSRATLQRLFSAAYGTSVMRYVESLRIARARELLAGGGAGVAAVAAAVGYPDANHFARVFRRHLGCAPGDFRRGRGSAATR
jgi:AraC-like DNA-binding protein